MQDGIWGDRERALEDVYFRGEDAKLLEKLRQHAHLDEIAVALGEKLQLHDPDLILKVKDQGVTIETAPAFFFAPLIQVAWSDGSVAKEERDAVLRQAQSRGLETGSAAYAKLQDWLAERPSDAFFATAIEVLRAGFDVLPLVEREQRINDIVHACREVAEASAGIGRYFGMDDGVSVPEGTILAQIAHALRSHD